MKRSTAIEQYEDQIKAEMINCHDTVLNAMGKIAYLIYVWEDGEIETLEILPGDNARLVAKEWENRKLFYVTTIQEECFDPWDYTNDSMPDDEDQRTAMEKEIIEYLADDYNTRCVQSVFDEILDYAIEDDERGWS